MAEAVYEAFRREPNNPQVQETLRNGLSNALVLSIRTPRDVLIYLKDEHNRWHAGAGMGLPELLEMCDSAGRAWTDHAAANGLTVKTCGTVGPSSYQKQMEKFVLEKFTGAHDAKIINGIFLQLVQFCYPVKDVPWLFADGLGGKEQWLLAPMEGSVLVKNQKRPSAAAAKAEAGKRRRISSGSAEAEGETLEEGLANVIEEADKQQAAQEAARGEAAKGKAKAKSKATAKLQPKAEATAKAGSGRGRPAKKPLTPVQQVELILDTEANSGDQGKQMQSDGTTREKLWLDDMIATIHAPLKFCSQPIFETVRDAEMKALLFCFTGKCEVNGQPVQKWSILRKELRQELVRSHASQYLLAGGLPGIDAASCAPGDLAAALMKQLGEEEEKITNGGWEGRAGSGGGRMRQSCNNVMCVGRLLKSVVYAYLCLCGNEAAPAPVPEETASSLPGQVALPGSASRIFLWGLQV